MDYLFLCLLWREEPKHKLCSFLLVSLFLHSKQCTSCTVWLTAISRYRFVVVLSSKFRACAHILDSVNTISVKSQVKYTRFLSATNTLPWDLFNSIALPRNGDLPSTIGRRKLTSWAVIEPASRGRAQQVAVFQNNSSATYGVRKLEVSLVFVQ